MAQGAKNRSYTKSGPGRRPRGHGKHATPRTAIAPQPEKKLIANVGRSNAIRQVRGYLVGWYPGERRVWREGEPIHIVKPVRAVTKAQAERDLQGEGTVRGSSGR